MKSSSPFTIIFLLLLLQETLFSAMADKQFIDNTCKATPSYDLCMSTLLADPSSQNADLTDLAIIIVNAVKDKGQQAINQIKSLKKSRPGLSPALTECGSVYHTVVFVDVPSTTDALNLGQAKYAEDGVADTAVETQACERSFSNRGQMSPMTGMNKAVEDLANVARAIIRMLL